MCSKSNTCYQKIQKKEVFFNNNYTNAVIYTNVAKL